MAPVVSVAPPRRDVRRRRARRAPADAREGEAERRAAGARPGRDRAVKLTRRQVLGGAAAGALGAAGVYELVDRLAGTSPERAAAAAPPPEQHVLDGVRIVEDGGVEVLVPPLHHEVVSANVAVDPADLADAQHALEDVLR